MRIALGNDHRGFVLKEQIEALIDELGHEWIDFGASDEHPVDYPDVAYEAALAVAAAEADRAILVCAIGMGMCIAANKVDGIRATVCCDEMTARLSRTHNDANVLCLGADFLGVNALRKTIEVWLSADFAGGRHKRRVTKIAAIEEGRERLRRRTDHVDLSLDPEFQMEFDMAMMFPGGDVDACAEGASEKLRHDQESKQ